MSWDLVLFNWIHGLAGWSVFTDSAGIFLADYLAYLLGLAVLFFIFKQDGWKKRAKIFLHSTLAVLISRGMLTELIRYLYDRPRPFAALGFSPLIGESSSSFPSGHAAVLFALGFLILSLNRRWGYWFLSLSLLNGLARIFAGVHYPTDVLGGVVVGFLAWGIVNFLLNKKEAMPEPIAREEKTEGESGKIGIGV